MRVRATLAGIALGSAAALTSLHASSDPGQPTVIRPDELAWLSPPQIPDLSVAFMVGAEREPGSYALRVRLRGGGRIPPHTHPDARNTVVLSGTLRVGFGETFDPARTVAVQPGEVYVAAAGVPHYLWAKDGDVEYQENGQGPTGSQFLGGPPPPPAR
jgi:quercetin dioxygenase-like cupin family protein